MRARDKGLRAASALFAAALAWAACTRTEDGVRIETEEAAATLERTGEAIQREAEELQRQAQPILDDAAVTAKVKAKLTADPEINPFEIDVDTAGGVVTLSGTVASAEVSAEAEKLTRRTSGVRAVLNRLRVEGGTGAAATPTPR